MGGWLESLVPWGTEVIIWAQSHNLGWLEAIFTFFTVLGYKEFYLFVLPVVYWCIDKRIGASLACVSLLSSWINSLFKYIFAIPRPTDPAIRVPLPETSPSFPSGHAQNAMVNFGYLAYRFRNRILWIIAIVVIAAIGLSRIVLGVHYPQDVIVGWLIGLVVLVVYIWAEPKVSHWLSGQTTTLQYALVVIIPLLLVFVHPADVEGLYPAEDAIVPMSALLGLGVGLIMERTRVRFRVDGEWWRRLIRFMVGLIVVGIVYAGPKLILPEGMAYSLEAALRFVRYALVGWAVAFLCPWLFLKLRLAEGEELPA